MDRRLVEDYLSTTPVVKDGSLVEREIEIKELLGRAVAILGPRRAGKSTLMKLHALSREKAVYMDFDNLIFAGADGREIYEIIRKVVPSVKGWRPTYLFLDEVQAIEGWELLVRLLIDGGYRLWVSGSSSKLLSKEIASSLRGRTLQHILLPFSFREFLKLKEFGRGKLEQEGHVLKALQEYLLYGGFPEVVKSVAKEELLNQYRIEILFRDIVERQRVSNTVMAKQILKHVFQNYSAEFSLRSLSRKVGYSPTPVREVVGGLEESFSILLLNKFSLKAHLREGWPKKLYLIDMGLALDFSENVGRKMENAVAVELFRRLGIMFHERAFYLKGRDFEVDFLLKKGPRVDELIQVTYASARDEIERRELKALLKASQLTGCRKLTVITWDYEDELVERERKVRFVPLWRWLLGRKLQQL